MAARGSVWRALHGSRSSAVPLWTLQHHVVRVSGNRSKKGRDAHEHHCTSSTLSHPSQRHDEQNFTVAMGGVTSFVRSKRRRQLRKMAAVVNSPQD